MARLMELGYIGTLDMVLSIYFYGHERWHLIPHLYKSLDKANRFQLAIAGNSYNHASDNSRIPEGDSPFSSYGESPF